MGLKKRLTALALGSSLVMSGAAHAGVFSIAVISDSQFMTEVYPSIFEAQMQWIVDNQVTENIVYVAQLGDLKDDLSCDNKLIAAPVGPARTEWEIVDDAFAMLETATSLAQPDGIPYGVVPGNHDFDQVGGIDCPNYTTQRPLGLYNNDPTLTADPHLGFPPSRFTGREYYGGSLFAGNNEDNYTLFEASGVKFIAINLGYRQDASPSTPELTWANDLLSTQFPDRLAIVTSHFLMECNTVVGVNEGTGCPSGNPINQLGNYGAQVYGALSGNPNLFLFLSAHRRGESYRIEGRTGMGPVHMLMSNYQSIAYPTGDPTDPATFSSLTTNDPVTGAVIDAGDSGFMRILRFDTDTGLVGVETFSPPMPFAPAVADPDGGGPIQGTPEVSARSLLTSVYFPTIAPPPASSQTNTGVHTATASNHSIDFTGYVPFLPAYQIFECDDVSGGVCTSPIGNITFPADSGAQTDGTGFSLTYTCSGTFCDASGYDEGDITGVDWTINAGSGELTALEMTLNTDPNCLTGVTPPPCSQTSVTFSLLAPGLTENNGQGGSCSPGPTCISGIAINGANLFERD